MLNPNACKNKSYDITLYIKVWAICLYNLYKNYKVHDIWLVSLLVLVKHFSLRDFFMSFEEKNTFFHFILISLLYLFLFPFVIFFPFLFCSLSSVFSSNYVLIFILSISILYLSRWSGWGLSAYPGRRSSLRLAMSGPGVSQFGRYRVCGLDL